MRKLYRLLFRRRLNPRTFFIAGSAAVIVLLIVLFLLAYSLLENEKPALVVNPPVFGEVELDRSALSVIHSPKSSHHDNSDESILSLGPVLTFAFSHDWKRIATVNSLGVFIWDITGERPALSQWLRNANEIPVSVEFSLDGQWLAQGNHKGSLTLWDLKNEKILLHIRAQHTTSGIITALSPDGNQVATGDNYGIVKIWDTRTAERIGRFITLFTKISSLSFSPDSRRILVGSSLGSKLWDIKENRLLLSKKGNPSLIWRTPFAMKPLALFSSNGKRILSHCSLNLTQPIVIWDVNLLEDRCEIERETFLQTSSFNHLDQSGYWNAVLSPDGQYVLSAWNKIHLWDAKSGMRIRAFENENGQAAFSAFSPDGQQIVVFNNRTKSFTFRDFKTGAIIRSLPLSSEITNYSMFLPDGRRILSGTSFGDTYIFDFKTGRTMRNPPLKKADTQLTTAYSSDGRWLLTQLMDTDQQDLVIGNHALKNVCNVWDVHLGEKIQTFKGHSSSLSQAIFSKDGSTIIGDDQKGTLTLWEIGTGRIITKIQGRLLNAIHETVFDTTQNWFAVNPKDSVDIDLWDFSKGAVIRRIKNKNALLKSIMVLPDEKSVLFCNAMGYLQIMDIENDVSYDIPSRIPGTYQGIALSPNAKYIAVVQSDGSVTLWELETMKKLGSVEIAQLRPIFTMGLRFQLFQQIIDAPNSEQNAPGIRCIDFSPDAKQLLINDAQGSIRFLDIYPIT